MIAVRYLAVLPVVFAAACAGPADAPCGGADGVIASDAWVRAAPDGRRMSAGYLDLCNGGADDRLIGVRFDGADAAELHITSVDDAGVARMQAAPEGIFIPAAQTVTLAPGGAHIMLIGLTSDLEPGDSASITLEFEHAAPQTLVFEVRSLADAASHRDH